MRLTASLIAFFACALVTFTSNLAHGLLAWSEYRVMDNSERTAVDNSIAEMLASFREPNSDGFKNKQIHFCVRESQIWETSINATCASTFQTARITTWPVVRTGEGVNFGWISVIRFATAFCDRGASAEVCERLLLHNKKKPPASSRSALLRIVELLFPLAHASGGESGGASSDTACRVTDDVMILKNGKKLYLDIGVQPAQQHASLLHSTAAMAASDKSTDTAVRDNLQQLKKMGSVIIRGYEEKKPWVIERIRKDQITWIGTEQSAEELGPRGGAGFAESFDALKTQLLSRKATKSLADEAMISGACPSASVCFWLQDKSTRKQIALVPLESDEAKQKTLALAQDNARIFKDLEGLVSTGRITKDELGLIQREFTNMTVSETPMDAKVRDALRRRYGHPEVSKAVLGFFDNTEALKKTIAERQRKMIEVAFAQNANGILSVGATQKAAMVPLLESLCQGPIERRTTLPATKR